MTVESSRPGGMCSHPGQDSNVDVYELLIIRPLCVAATPEMTMAVDHFED